MSTTEHIEQIHALNLAFAATEQQLKEEITAKTQREQEVAAQLLAAQQQAEQQRAELARSHSEQERILRHQYAERETALQQQLQAGHQELQRLQLELAQREKGHAEQANQTRQELETLLRQQVQREQEVAAQLLAVQQQAEQQRAELARSHSEQERTLRHQCAERETALNQQLQAGQQELQRLQQEWALRVKEHAEQNSQSRQALESQLRNQVQREQEIAAQLLHIQQQAEQEKTELARRHSEQERVLQREHAERQQVVAQQLQAAQETIRNLERDWAQNEKALSKEIAVLQHDVQALHHSKQMLTQQHDAELSTKLDEHQRVLAACAALEAELKAELWLEQQASLRLRQSLAEVQQNLDRVHMSLSWRMTALLRKLASFIVPKSNYAHLSQMTEEGTRPIGKATATEQSIDAKLASAQPQIPTTMGEAYVQTTDAAIEPDAPPLATSLPISESPSINAQRSTIEPIMPPPAQVTMPPTLAPAPASTLDELLALHDQHFIQCAYQMLLGRAPDPEGLGYYLGRLRTGISKIRIVAQLRLSNEGKAHAAKLPGLDTAIQRHQKEQYPLIGGLFRRLNGAEGNHPTERKLRAIENQLWLISDESNRRFNQLEIALTGLQNLIVQKAQYVATTIEDTSLASPSGPSISTIQSPTPDGIKQLSQSARKIYFQLKKAASRHANGDK